MIHRCEYRTQKKKKSRNGIRSGTCCAKSRPEFDGKHAWSARHTTPLPAGAAMALCGQRVSAYHRVNTEKKEKNTTKNSQWDPIRYLLCKIKPRVRQQTRAERQAPDPSARWRGDGPLRSARFRVPPASLRQRSLLVVGYTPRHVNSHRRCGERAAVQRGPGTVKLKHQAERMKVL